MQRTLQQLTLEEKVGQMLQVWMHADDPDFTGPEYTFLRDEIQKYHIGSVDLSARMLGPNLGSRSLHVHL